MYATLGVLLTISVVVKSRSLNLDDDMLLYWRRSGREPPCEPFTEFAKDCNTCVCGADGIASCTRMDCGKFSNVDKPLSTRSPSFIIVVAVVVIINPVIFQQLIIITIIIIVIVVVIINHIIYQQVIIITIAIIIIVIIFITFSNAINIGVVTYHLSYTMSKNIHS